jgi:Fe-S cluster assembly protein SufD
MSPSLQTVTEATKPYADFFAEQASLYQKGALAKWAPLREEALRRFCEMGFPTHKHEEWKYTPLRALTRAFYEPAQEPPVPDLQLPAVFEGPQIVFLNGFFQPHLSTPLDQEGVFFGTLSQFAEKTLSEGRDLLGSCAPADWQFFVALNTAFFSDGAFLHVPKNTVAESPLIIRYLSTASSPTLICPRNLILVEENSQAIIIEEYETVGEGAVWTNAVTEFLLGDGAVAHHVKIQRESTETHHLSFLATRQGRSSSLTSHVIGLGGALTRNEILAVLDGEGGECFLNGLYLLKGHQHYDTRTVLDHAQPFCSSREFYKGILDDESHGVFSGKIVVRPGAQKTDAKQSNMNLLLARGATINSKPQLEIFADDVKCTHGATIGRIDEEALFYLRSRGMDEASARSLLIYAFASEILLRLPLPWLRHKLEMALFERLPGEIPLRGLPDEP